MSEKHKVQFINKKVTWLLAITGKFSIPFGIGLAYLLIVMASVRFLGFQFTIVPVIVFSVVLGILLNKFYPYNSNSPVIDTGLSAQSTQEHGIYCIQMVFTYVGVLAFFGIINGLVTNIGASFFDQTPVKNILQFVFTDKVSILLFNLNMAGYLLSGWLCGRTAPSVNYWYPLVGTINAIAVNNSLIVYLMLKDKNISDQIIAHPLVFVIPNLLYGLSSMAGAKLGFKERLKTNTSKPSWKFAD